MSAPQDQKEIFLKRIVGQLENPEALAKTNSTHSIVLLVISIITLLVPLMYFGFSEKKEYLMVLLTWLSGISIGTAIMTRLSLGQWGIIKEYLDIGRIKSDLKDRNKT
ncbi:MAG: hypothetical protein JKY50_19315 [Oleispira sp.]|nr:hypothetical protein [Oleispira sp.]